MFCSDVIGASVFPTASDFNESLLTFSPGIDGVVFGCAADGATLFAVLADLLGWAVSSEALRALCV